jgi:curved DNA-binding protein
MSVAFRDYYETLGVSREASTEEIRRAYRKLARQHHPDVSKDDDAEDRFKAISEAYEVLRDSEKRERYDRFGAGWKTGQDVSGAPGFEEGRVEFGEGFQDGSFSDFFESLFGQAGAARGRGGAGRDAFSARGGDHMAEMEITLEEAAEGGSRRFTLEDGRSYQVNVPPGVRDGQRIRLAGEGGSGSGGGPSGDLFLRVRLRPHPRFHLEGRDLHADVRVAPWEAALGATVEVPTLEGSASMKVPAGSSSGRRLRLRGQGYPGPGKERGDLYVAVRIVVPERLDDEESKLFEQLAATSKFQPRKGSR